MRDTGNQAKYEQLLDDAGLEIRKEDKEGNVENAILNEVYKLSKKLPRERALFLSARITCSTKLL